MVNVKVSVRVSVGVEAYSNMVEIMVILYNRYKSMQCQLK